MPQKGTLKRQIRQSQKAETSVTTKTQPDHSLKKWLAIVDMQCFKDRVIHCFEL